MKNITFLKSKKAVSVYKTKNYLKLSINKNRIIQSKDTLLIGIK
jgi:hypothetical protein